MLVCALASALAVTLASMAPLLLLALNDSHSNSPLISLLTVSSATLPAPLILLSSMSALAVLMSISPIGNSPRLASPSVRHCEPRVESFARRVSEGGKVNVTWNESCEASREGLMSGVCRIDNESAVESRRERGKCAPE